MADTQYRIKKGVKPWGGKVLHADAAPNERGQVTGHIRSTYKNYGPYVYRLDELEPLTAKGSSK